jgi:hypothetical protein
MNTVERHLGGCCSSSSSFHQSTVNLKSFNDVVGCGGVNRRHWLVIAQSQVVCSNVGHKSMAHLIFRP